MEIIKIIKSEFDNFGKYEKIFFPSIIVLICIISFLINDDKIALISAICGISYTILAGKGRISCYFIGITGTLCYSYLSLKNGFYGSLILYAFYYLPMEIIGIFQWRKHLKKEIREIEKTLLSKKERIIYSICAIFFSCTSCVILNYMGDRNPVIDAFSAVLSIFAQILTVKRCIEQWYVWFIVNFLSVIMWIKAYIDGVNCFAAVIMWSIYLILSVYFLKEWKKEIKQQNIRTI